jgi:hypothetical protein
VPNIQASGNIIEAGMFVLNAELRKWDFTNPSFLIYQLYSHPNVAPSGFEPKTNGQTLNGDVGARPSILSVDNIETMRTNLSALFSVYSEDSIYSFNNFKESWLVNAYRESESGALRFVENGLSLDEKSPEFLHPPMEDVTGGDFIVTLDDHWLGGSGVLFDIDYGEVIFNPFPFPNGGNFGPPSQTNFALAFGPVTPMCQTTLGNLPSLEVDRYESDVTGAFGNINFAAIGSGKVQIDGYCLLENTKMELIRGNDTNYFPTLTGSSDYTGHVRGLRPVRPGTDGKNDDTARCYRTPSVQSSGLYRFITYNERTDYSETSIGSGYVSIFPEGLVTRSSPNGVLANVANRIDGQQFTEASDGTVITTPGLANGIHVFDDAIWMVGAPSVSNPSIPNTNSRGLFCISPHNGHSVWYRPAEMTVATTGTAGENPSAWGTHLGLVDDGSNYVRLSRSFDQVITVPALDDATGVYTLYWQKYDKITLDYTESSSSFSEMSTDISAVLFVPNFEKTLGLLDGGGTLYTWQRNTVQSFDSSFNYIAHHRPDGPGIAGRRHYAGGDLLYTMTGSSIGANDPLLSITGGISSGIGKWSTSATQYTHDSAKPLRAETHFGHKPRAVIHSIFDVIGATHVQNGIWMFITFPSSAGGFITNDPLYLCRILEGTTAWSIIESIKLDNVQNIGVVGGPEFPVEGILQDLN